MSHPFGGPLRDLDPVHLPFTPIDWPYPPHPYADCLPMMVGKEYDDLAADIKNHGLSEPIVLLDGMVLDGRNRLRACLEVGREPKYRQFDPATDRTPLRLVIAKNLMRRNLTTEQRAVAAARLANVPHGGHRRPGPATPTPSADGTKGQEANLPLDPDDRTTLAEAAAQLGVSERTVKSAGVVERDGTAELKGMLNRSEVSVDAAAQVATLPPDEQAAVVAGGADAVKAAAAEVRKEKKRKGKGKKKAKSGSTPVTEPTPAPVKDWAVEVWEKVLHGERQVAAETADLLKRAAKVSDTYRLSANARSDLKHVIIRLRMQADRLEGYAKRLAADAESGPAPSNPPASDAA